MGFIVPQKHPTFRAVKARNPVHAGRSHRKGYTRIGTEKPDRSTTAMPSRPRKPRHAY